MLCSTISVEHKINRTKSGNIICSINVLFDKYRIVELRNMLCWTMDDNNLTLTNLTTTDRYMDRQTDGQTDRWTVGQTDYRPMDQPNVRCKVRS